jgi:DNA-binding MarR family transcriptional regulator
VIRSYRPVLAELELTHPQYLVLLVLWGWARNREKRPTIKALGERLDLDSGTLTPLLKRLQSRGLITRTRSTEDERELFVHLTPAGAALKKRARRVPTHLLSRSPIPLNKIIELRDQLKQLRTALAGAT